MNINSKPAAPSDDVHLIVAKDEEVVIEHYPEDWIAFALFWGPTVWLGRRAAAEERQEQAHRRPEALSAR